MKRILALVSILGLAACGASEPSREDVRSSVDQILHSGVNQEFFTEIGLDEQSYNEHVDCMTDGIISTLSTESQRIIADGSLAIHNAEDEAKFAEVTTECGERITAKLGEKPGDDR